MDLKKFFIVAFFENIRSCPFDQVIPNSEHELGMEYTWQEAADYLGGWDTVNKLLDIYAEIMQS